MTVCNRTIRGLQGVIESPNFPNNYPPNIKCLWNIVVPMGNKINISFSHFDLENSKKYNNSCYTDYVEVSISKFT